MFKSQRDYFGEALLEVGETNPKILVLTADLENSLRLTDFRQKYPNRFFNVGVAEQNLIGVAVGLSLENFIPFCASFAVFLPGRCFDQIRVSVCQNKLPRRNLTRYPAKAGEFDSLLPSASRNKTNVKLVGGHLGFSNAGDGASAQSVEDIALMRSLPEMVVLCPYDGEETKSLVKLAAEYQGPVYLRISKSDVPEKVVHLPGGQMDSWKVGGARVLKEGRDLTILSHGPILGEVLKVAISYQLSAISLEIIDAYSVKPLDKETILKSATKTGKVLVIEEHSIYGGLGSAVAELLSQEYPIPVKILGIPDVFGESARDWKQLLAKYGLVAENIARTIKEMV